MLVLLLVSYYKLISMPFVLSNHSSFGRPPCKAYRSANVTMFLSPRPSVCDTSILWREAWALSTWTRATATQSRHSSYQGSNGPKVWGSVGRLRPNSSDRPQIWLRHVTFQRKQACQIWHDRTQGGRVMGLKVDPRATSYVNVWIVAKRFDRYDSFPAEK